MPSSISPIPIFPEFSMEFYLLFVGICLGAYAGSFLRLCFLGFKVWPIETNYTVLWVNIIGCIIMGFFKHHQVALFDKSKSR
jgi:fluoride ion exporter CrcB/FEX